MGEVVLMLFPFIFKSALTSIKTSDIGKIWAESKTNSKAVAPVALLPGNTANTDWSFAIGFAFMLRGTEAFVPVDVLNLVDSS